MFTVGNLDAILYCFQQLGVMLSVGAETVLLIAYMFATKDGVVDEAEARFARVIRRALAGGIASMVISGLAITALHWSLGEGSVVFQPAFLFKWLIILSLTAAYILQWRRPFLHYLVEGGIGATWYALFLLHILAPITTWGVLLSMYIVFFAVFEGGWALAVLIRKRAPRPRAPVLAFAGVAQAPARMAPTAQPAQKPPSSPAAMASNPAVSPQPAAPSIIVPVSVVPPAPSKPALAPAAPLPMQPMQESQKNPLPISMPETFTPKLAELPVQPAVPPPALPIVADHDPHSSPWLPAIHVMPKSQEDLDAKTHVTPMANSKHALTV